MPHNPEQSPLSSNDREQLISAVAGLFIASAGLEGGRFMDMRNGFRSWTNTLPEGDSRRALLAQFGQMLVDSHGERGVQDGV